MAKDVDYSLYLVTGRELLPPGIDYYESLEASIRDGGVTMVQLREKYAETSEFLDIAKRSLDVCDKYKVPMLINDNLAVVLSLPERVGLHIGQTDLPISEARRLIGSKRLLGHSVHNAEQAKEALTSGIADYVGVGPVYGTKSKAGIEDKDVLTVRGAHHVIKHLQEGERRMPSVLIGGINQKTAARALYGTTSKYNRPDGIAVISAIVARKDPGPAARELTEILKSFHDETDELPRQERPFEEHTNDTMIGLAAETMQRHRESSLGPPLIQTLTSHVSSTLSANIALAFSASPIMSHQEAEAEDLAKVTSGVVLNIGTIGEEARRGMRAVGNAANRHRKPVVLDPVGVGASAFRREVVEEIMNHTQVTLIKGNAAELSCIAGLTEVASRGVDSGTGTLSDPEGLVKRLALQERCLVLLTGKIDYLSNGTTTVKIHNGHPLLGKITGSGCALGVTVAIGLAAACREVKQRAAYMLDSLSISIFHGALTGILALTIASELAAERADVKGPGSFIPALIDELATLRPEHLQERARIEMVQGVL